MKIRTACSVLGDLRIRHLTPGYRRKLFSADPNDLFFSDGWGDESELHEIKALPILTEEPTALCVEWHEEVRHGTYSVRRGSFASPFPSRLLAPESREAQTQWYLPRGHDANTPHVIVFPMTGDEGFEWREKHFALPLLNRGIATILVENPYYGARRPAAQKSFTARTVRDILVMCAAAVAEGRALVRHLESLGYQRLGVAGVSQGGMLAAIVGASMPRPVAIASSLVPHSAEVIFSEGALKNFVNWKALGTSPEDGRGRFRELFGLGDLARLAPALPRAVELLGAKRDLVVPRHSVEKVHQAWEGSRLRWLPGTHITSLALHSRSMRGLVSQSLESAYGK